jgi:hypothetical protein
MREWLEVGWVQLVVGITIGALCSWLITWLTTRHYYNKSKKHGDESIKNLEKIIENNKTPIIEYIIIESNNTTGDIKKGDKKTHIDICGQKLLTELKNLEDRKIYITENKHAFLQMSELIPCQYIDFPNQLIHEERGTDETCKIFKYLYENGFLFKDRKSSIFGIKLITYRISRKGQKVIDRLSGRRF